MISIPFNFIAFTVLLMFLPSCTNNLKVDQLNKETSEPVEGVLYYLPQKEFEIELIRQIKTCDIKNEIEIIHSVNILDKNLVDFLEAYVIKYRELDSKTKKIDFEVNLHPNGIIKSVNLAATDQTREILSNTLTGAIKIARTALLPGSGLLAGKREPEELCSNNVKVALNKLSRLNQTKEKKVKKLEKQMEEIEKLSEGQKGPTEVAIKRLQTDLEEIFKQITQVSKVITSKQIYTFRPSRDLPHITLSPNKSLIDNWFNHQGLKDFCQEKPNSCISTQFIDGTSFNLPDAIFAFAEIYMPNLPLLISSTPIELGNPQVSKDDIQATNQKVSHPNITTGLIYRQPTEAILMICSKIRCISEDKNFQVESSFRLFEKKFNIPQLGIKMHLPLVNKVFEDKTLKAEFSLDGGLIMFKYTSNASAVETSAAFKDSTESAIKLAEEKRKSNEDSINQEIKQVETQRRKIEEQIMFIQKERELKNLLQAK